MHDDDLDALPEQRRAWQRGSAMPASSQAQRNKNRKRTARSDAAQKRNGLASARGGINETTNHGSERWT